jgi:hypothetical protein
LAAHQARRLRQDCAVIGYNHCTDRSTNFKGHILSSTPSNKPGVGVTKNDENDAVEQFEKSAPDEPMTAEVYNEPTGQEEGHHTVSTSAYYRLEDYGYGGGQDWLEADVETDGWLDTGGDF